MCGSSKYHFLLMQANQTPWCFLLHHFLPTCFQISEMMAQLWSSILQPHLKRVGCDLPWVAFCLFVWLRGKGCNILNRTIIWEGISKFFGILEGKVPVSNRHSLLQTNKTGWKATVFHRKNIFSQVTIFQPAIVCFPKCQTYHWYILEIQGT